MFYLYYLGVVVASLLATELMPEAISNTQEIIGDDIDEGDEELFKFIMFCSMGISIALSWYTVGGYLLRRLK
jgi:hypothetical protein